MRNHTLIVVYVVKDLYNNFLSPLTKQTNIKQININMQVSNEHNKPDKRREDNLRSIKDEMQWFPIIKNLITIRYGSKVGCRNSYGDVYH